MAIVNRLSTNTKTTRTQVAAYDITRINDEDMNEYALAIEEIAVATDLNTLKTGITAGQASAITANTAKISYSTAASDAVALNTAKISYSTAASDAVALNTAKISATGIIDVTEVGNTAGILKIQPDVQGDVEFFGDTDVGDATPGNRLTVHRRAVEGNSSVSILMSSSNKAQILTTSDLNFISSGTMSFSSSGGSVNLATEPASYASVFNLGGVGVNQNFRQYGYITAAAAQKYVFWQVDDTTDQFVLDREDSNILGFKVSMDLEVTGDVGIGTNIPQKKLHVSSAASDIFRLERTAAGGGVTMELKNGDGFIGSWSLSGLEVMTFNMPGTADAFNIDNSGNVAIPNGNLEVTGNITVSGTVDGIDIATDVAANTAKVSGGTLTYASIAAMLATAAQATQQTNALYFVTDTKSTYRYKGSTTEVLKTDYDFIGGPSLQITYTTEALMFAGQAFQWAGMFYKADDTELFYHYKGTTVGDITDYDGAASIEETPTINCSDYETVVTTANKGYWVAPWACTLQTVFASWSVDAATATATTLDVNKNGTTMATTTKVTINAGATDSSGATQPVFTTTAIAQGDKISIDVDAVGTAGKGLSIALTVTR